MNLPLNNTDKLQYYSGGLAELVDSPSRVTLDFLQRWFTGKKSLGKAMSLLELPYVASELSILDVVNGELMVNLQNEEATLYAPTIFSYDTKKSTHDAPKLSINWKKVFSFYALRGTARMLLTQSRWIASPDQSIRFAEELIAGIPTTVVGKTSKECDDFLANSIWPSVLAVGSLSEFYHQLLMKDVGESRDAVNQYISQELTQQDWFFRSVADQQKVKEGVFSFTDFMAEFGLRSDKDYELTSPRWNEVPEVIQRRIESFQSLQRKESEKITLESFAKNLQQKIVTSLKLQVLRSEVKKKALIHIAHLRALLIQEKIITKNMAQENSQTSVTEKNVAYGKGTSISPGLVQGKVLHILNVDQDVSPGTIGIFPNASPEFAVQYPKCVGMIFGRGGQTSHGAIVAREFHIPALVDRTAMTVAEGITIEMNGTTGEWRVL